MRQVEVFDRTYMLLDAAGVVPNLELIRSYAAAVSELEEAQAELDKGDLTQGSGPSLQHSPYLTIRDRALATVERLGASLGIEQARALEGVQEPKQRRGVPLTVPRAYTALKASCGVVAQAARLLRVPRMSLVDFIAEHPELQTAKADILEQMKDLSDTKLFEGIRAGNMTAIKWFQANMARDRGYGRASMPFDKRDEQGHTGPNPTTLAELRKNLEQLSDEELAAFNLIAAKLAGGGGAGPTGDRSGDDAEGRGEVPGVLH